LPPKVALARAHETAIQAAQLDPASPDVLLASAVTKLYYDHDFAASEQDFRRAIEADPGNADANFYYSQCLVAMGRSTRRSPRLAGRSVSILGRRSLPLHRSNSVLRSTVRRGSSNAERCPGHRSNYGFTQIVLVTVYEQLHRYDERWSIARPT
jgi:hypothetical protein